MNYTEIESSASDTKNLFVNLSCPNPSLSSCSMNLTPSCPTSPSLLTLTCLPSPQCNTQYSTPLPSPYFSPSWSLSLTPAVAACTVVYLDSVKTTNIIPRIPGQATTVLLS